MNKTTLTFSISLIFSLSPCQADVTTDGNAGPALSVPLEGNNFAIGQELGTLSGNNLFHSFSQFNLTQGQIATFSGDPAIQNVISRVTGGASSIDGTIKSDIGQAAFYFINPAGIVFGEHASVDVPGAFYASTANELQFADGKVFNASNPQASSFSMAAPAAFGFLGAQTGTLEFNGSVLAFKQGATVQLSANKITVTGTDKEHLAAIKGDGVDLQLAAVGNIAESVGVTALPDHALQGELSLSNSELDTSGDGAGRVVIRAGNMNMKNSNIFADNSGSKDDIKDKSVDLQVKILDLNYSKITSDAIKKGSAGNINISAQNALSMNKGSEIHSYTNSKGNTGNVTVKAQNISINNGGIGTFTDVSSGGSAGYIIVDSENIQMNSGAVIFSQTNAQGNAGDVTVKTRTLRMSGGNINSDSASSGNSGLVSIKASNIHMDNNAEIHSLTKANGSAGQVNVEADNIHINGKSEISSQTEARGNAGDVNVRARILNITGEGRVSTDSSSSGNTGQVSVEAETIQMDRALIASTSQSGKGNLGDVSVKGGGITLDNDSFIGSLASDDSHGNAGKITVTTQNELSVSNGSAITSLTTGEGAAGNLNVNAKTIRLDGNSQLTSAAAQGKAGDIDIKTDNLLIDGKSKIKSDNLVTGGQTGVITIEAGKIHLNGESNISVDTENKTRAGDINVNAQTIQIGGGSSISSRADEGLTGDAGTVSIKAQNELTMDYGLISTSTFGKGNAGKVTIEAGNLRLDKNAHILSNSYSTSTGNAGTVAVTTNNNLTIMNGGSIRSNTSGSGNAGEVMVNSGTIRMDGAMSYITSVADKDSTGNAGSIKITARNDLILSDGAEIISSTFGHGNAGNVDVNAETIQLNEQKGGRFLTAIGSTSEGGKGSVGSVTLTATKGLSMNNSQISIRSNTISATPENLISNKINITSPQINLSNNSKIDAASTGNVPASAIQINTNQLTVKGNSQITTTANQSNGGPISINANDWLFLDNSQIATSVTGVDNGNGGDITLNGDILIMDSGFIQANTSAPKANGGNINLNIKQLVYSQDNLQRGGNTPLVFSLNSGQNVIQAASPDGVNGNINITAPQLNVVGALAGLNAPELDLSRVGQDPCSSVARQSTLKSLGKGGAPSFNNDQDGYTIDHLLDATPHDAANVPQRAVNAANEQQDC